MYLGLDLGTSGLRALLVDADGAALASAEATYSVSHPHSGWSEQDPADWIAACQTAMDTLAAQQPDAMRRIRGLAVSGQMHGATLLDAHGTVLRPCMLWNDTRSHAQAARLDAEPAFRALTGNIVFPGFTAPKVKWVQQEEPDVFAQISKILLPKDYLGFWLTGRYVSDMSDSAGTGWLDVGARAWSPQLLEFAGLRQSQMPDLVEGSSPIGEVLPERAKLLGLPEGVIVMGGGGDNAAAACGIGALDDGDGFVSLGTSGVLLAAKSGFAPAPATAVHTFCHAVPDRWYQMGVILAATDSLNWLATIFGKTPESLTEVLDPTLSAPGRVRFLPYLSGERTPHNDSEIRGGFLNLDISTGQTDLTRAVMEGVAFALRDNLEALRKTGTALDRVIAIGGGSRSRLWLEMIATTLDLPIDLPVQGEFGAAMGAARLAICGVTQSDPADVMIKPDIADTIIPNVELKDAYHDAWQAFQATYPALRTLP